MDEYILKINNLSVYDSNVCVLNNVNFDLKRGEVHTLVGAKEADLKNFIDLLSGSLKNGNKNIIFNNREIKIEQLAAQKNSISFILNDNFLFEEFTVLENLFIKNDSFYSYRLKKECRRSAVNLSDEIGFKIDLNEKVYKLSVEEKKIVAILRSYFKTPDITVMYMTLNYLNLENSEKLVRLIDILKGKGKSFIYITNKFEDTLKLPDRISVINNSKITGTFTIDSVKKNPKKVMYLLSDWENFKEDKIDHESIEVFDTILKGTELLTSSHELRSVLKFLTNNIAKIMNADSCIIYLIDENYNNVVDTIDFEVWDNSKAKLKYEFIEKIIKKPDIFYATSNEKDFSSYFVNQNEIKTIIGLPILLRSKIAGFIQISYKAYYIYSKKESIYMSTFSNEVAIAIESSRLMGNSSLLKETHHRIKNNLQVIISLLYMQKSMLKESKVNDYSTLIDPIIYRIKSIAAIHDILSNDNLKRSNINIERIIDEVVKFYINTKIKIILSLDNIYIPYNRATSIALLINELVNNCFKHAFPDEKSGEVNILCKNNSTEIYLLIQDNGIGLPKDFDFNKISSIGLSIVITIILKEFNGKIEFANNNGTIIDIRLPKSSLYAF